MQRQPDHRRTRADQFRDGRQLARTRDPPREHRAAHRARQAAAHQRAGQGKPPGPVRILPPRAGAVSAERQPEGRAEKQQRADEQREVRAGIVHGRHLAQRKRENTREPQQQGRSQPPEQAAPGGGNSILGYPSEGHARQQAEQRPRNQSRQPGDLKGQAAGQSDEAAQPEGERVRAAAGRLRVGIVGHAEAGFGFAAAPPRSSPKSSVCTMSRGKNSSMSQSLRTRSLRSRPGSFTQ